MANFDLVLSGGTIVTPWGSRVGDLAVEGERIAAIAEPGRLSGASHRTIALGAEHVVLPGGIDPHVHCNWVQTDPSTGEKVASAGPGVVSRAALYGGTTTLLDFVTTGTGDITEQVAARDQLWARESIVDYGLHVILHGRVPEEHIAAIPGLIRDGYTSFKVFTTTVRPGAQVKWAIDFGSLVQILTVTGAEGGLVAVHAEDDDMVMHAYDVHLRSGKVDPRYLPDVHDPLSETVAIERVLSASSRIPGSRVYVMHVSSRMATEALARAKRAGIAVTAETLHQYTTRTDADYESAEGMRFHNYPSLKGADDVAALWEGIASGTIDTLATDELCLPYTVKIAGQRIDNAVGGSSSIETRLALLYTEAVVKRGIGLSRFADIIATNAARIFGMYPRKGVLGPGADADIVVMDTTDRRTIRASELHESDYNPFEGVEVAAWPMMTVHRGQVVVDHGVLTDAVRAGNRVERTVEANGHSRSSGGQVGQHEAVVTIG